ncbi:MAG: PLP-dependent aminotransferase family protein [Desulfobacteraceae bacterium]|nr:PLP-dependent aminotransferase family protein [Desulfobacteraceae bacterium]
MALFENIAEEIRKRIQSGQYKPGQKIPSIRDMAVEFECNKLTVQKAFERLKQDRYLDNIVGSGSFVRFPENISRSGAVYDLKTAYVSEHFFPHQVARNIFNHLFDTEKAGLFSTTPVEGEKDFREVLGRQFRLSTDRMLIVSGAQQGLDLTAKVFGARLADAMLFEDPTYPGAISLFKATHFVPMEKDGPDLSMLDRALSPKIKLFYTMPTVHNPTGITYSPEKKREIADRALTGDFYIIEDDYLSEFVRKPVTRFVDIVPEKTVYIKSLTQTTVSGIRLGFMIVPDSLYDKFLYTKYSSDIVSPGIMQKFMKRFIQTGAYGEYVAGTQRRINRRKKRLIKVLNAYPALFGGNWDKQSGYSLWVKSSMKIDLPHLPWDKGENFSFSRAYKNHLKISFMNLGSDDFERSLRYLEELFERICTP